MGWKRKAGIGCAGAALLIAAAVGALLWFKPWVPEIQMADPGETGRRIVGNGLIANYFPAAGDGPHPAILLLGGSEGGLGESTKRTALALQREGFSVLQLSYFRAPGQTERLELVPLEYFGRALDWLRLRPEVDAERMAVVGASKGAEAALILATRRPDVAAVVAGMPSSVVWPGISWEGGSTDSSWSENGEPMPFVPYGDLDWSFDIGAMYESGFARVAEYPDAVIPLERTTAPILLVCGEADSLSPSCPMARQLRIRANEADGPEVAILAYPDAGHGVFGQPLPEGAPNFDQLGGLGGSPAGNNAARADGWPKIAAFLKSALAGRTTRSPGTQS